MTDQTTPGTDLIVHPLTGETLAIDAPTDVLAAALDEHRTLLSLMAEYKTVLQAEVLRRMDAANSRSEPIGGYKITVNAPRVEEYNADALRERLEQLVDDGVLDPVVPDRVIAPPKPPAPKVDKREVNKLKGHPDDRVRQAVAESCEEVPQNRTVKIERVA